MVFLQISTVSYYITNNTTAISTQFIVISKYFLTITSHLQKQNLSADLAHMFIFTKRNSIKNIWLVSGTQFLAWFQFYLELTKQEQLVGLRARLWIFSIAP